MQWKSINQLANKTISLGEGGMLTMAISAQNWSKARSCEDLVWTVAGARQFSCNSSAAASTSRLDGGGKRSPATGGAGGPGRPGG